MSVIGIIGTWPMLKPVDIALCSKTRMRPVGVASASCLLKTKLNRARYMKACWMREKNKHGNN